MQDTKYVPFFTLQGHALICGLWGGLELVLRQLAEPAGAEANS